MYMYIHIYMNSAQICIYTVRNLHIEISVTSYEAVGLEIVTIFQH